MAIIVRLELTEAEADLVGAQIAKARDLILDARPREGCAALRLITEIDEEITPIHQSILRKIEAGIVLVSDV